MSVSAHTRALQIVEKYGLLLVSDARVPSVAGIVTGEKVHGSWWAHPRSHDIFRVNQFLAEHPHIAVAKLIYGKVTFVHRKLWAALVAVGSACETWQTEGLSPAALSLMKLAVDRGALRIDEIPAELGSNQKEVSGAARELEARLLVYAEDVHSESGRHTKQLESSKHWALRVKADTAKPAREGRIILEDAAAKLCPPSGEQHPTGKKSRPSLLPWNRGDSTRKSD
jgi:hypothetical protein